VDSLSLPTWKHPQPHCVEWLYNSGKLKVTHKVRLKFSVGNYEDTVICDVLPMDACHVLLGRPWQFDKRPLMKEDPMFIPCGIKGNVMCCALCLTRISKWIHLL
jgi:hypothetical protein